MVPIEVRPLVIVREHAGGFFSVFPAFAPSLVSHADEREDALDELRLFLGEHFARLEGDQVLELVVSEAASVREISVTLPRNDLPRAERIRTPLKLPVIELEAPGDSRWVLVPAFGHVIYVAKKRLGEIEAHVRQEVLRVAAASDLDGARYLDLLPPLSYELERPLVEVEVAAATEAGRARTERIQKKKQKLATKLLESVARRLGPRERDVLHRDPAALKALLDGEARASAVLVGPPGAGKSALLRAALVGVDRPVFATSGAELVAGQSHVGQLEQRVSDVMQAAELLDAVLYFEELDDLFAGRPGGYEDIAGLMQRWIERGRVRVIGELTPERYDRLQHRHVGFFSYLSRIAVEPLGPAHTVDVLCARGQRARDAGEPALSDAAAPLVVELVERYDPYRSLPGKALALLDELAAHKRAEPPDDGSLEIAPDDVFRGVSTKTGVPEFLLRDERSMLIEHVERFFHQRLVGQAQAVRHVAEVLCAVKAGLQPAQKPLAAFLFIGPTGVGKTELAKALARFLFGSSERMARFDMSEFADPYAAERLIRGTDREDGVLTRRIREQPFSVLLLDEIEKADPAVFDLLLQVIGEGRLSDAQGKVAHFVNSIIIMTSNLGARHRRGAVGFGEARDGDDGFYLAQVREHFRPEFVNRLDRVVSFYNLSREQIHEVTRLSIARIATREGFDERNVRLWVSERAVATLAEAGFSAAYGARGLRRHLEQNLVAPAASALSSLGGDAVGRALVVQADDEPGDIRGLREALADPSLGDELGREERGGIVVRLLGRARRRAEVDVAGVVGICKFRRDVRGWLGLPAIREIRERIAEIQAQLALASGGKRARRRAPQGPVLGQLAAEHARLSEMLQPLDASARELDDIESLVIAALYEGEQPKLLEPEAKAAYARFRAKLVTALMARAEEHEITLALHELDNRKVLERLLLPLLEYLRENAWEVRVHVDRGERTPADQWPSADERRWGPPRSIEQYLASHGDDRRFASLLVRVRGHAAGALLSFAVGRWRYALADGAADIWVRLVAAKYELTNDDFARPSLHARPNPEVGRRQPLCVEVVDDRIGEIPASNLFRHYSEIFFDRVVEVAESNAGYLPVED